MNKNSAPSEKLTPAEAKRLEQFVTKNGGQLEARRLFGNCAPATLSRTAHRHTAPSALLLPYLIEHKIVIGPRIKELCPDYVQPQPQTA